MKEPETEQKKTIRVLCGRETILPKTEGTQLLPVYALADSSVSGVIPIPKTAVPSQPYGLFLNRYYRECDLADLQALLSLPIVQNAELLYFADPAVVSCLPASERKKLIYRPETLITSAADAQFWCSAGIGGCCVSPVLTAEETIEIIRQCPLCEVMIHGRILLSLSARKLVSAWLEEAGLPSSHAQSRRLTLQEETRTANMPVLETEQGTMIFSETCLESFSRIQAMNENGCMHYFISGAFLEDDELQEILCIYTDLLKGKNCDQRIQALREQHPEYSEGFYDRRTIL